jgi:hypothetical protein
MENEQHKFVLELIDDESIHISLTGDPNMIARMLFSSMLRNEHLASIVVQCSKEYEKQLEENKNALLN